MKIAVLAGGTSTERNVSLTTSLNVYKALRKLGHSVALIDVFYGMGSRPVSGCFDEDTDIDKEVEELRKLNDETGRRASEREKDRISFFGEGVLIMGDSGIGKSEAALELIKRGHRLVADDVVEIKKISDEQLIGQSPAITRHFIELRGIGIIDVKTMFGVECVKISQQVDLVIKLEEWDKDANYDRLGLSDSHIEILGTKIVSHSIPIRPGRNLAIIVESAAVNHRQKKMGYNAAQEMYNRVTKGIQNKQ